MSQEPQVKAIITEVLPNQLYRVKLDSNGREIVAYLAGKLKINHIRCLAGDRVSLVVSPEGDKARIVYRG